MSIATGARMKYEAYEAHADLMAHMRLYSEAALATMKQPWLAELPAGPSDALRRGGSRAFASPQSFHAQYSCAGGTFHHSMS